MERKHGCRNIMTNNTTYIQKKKETGKKRRLEAKEE
jgi:hypothetical protein